jgi:hypothetical protein
MRTGATISLVALALLAMAEGTVYGQQSYGYVWPQQAYQGYAPQAPQGYAPQQAYYVVPGQAYAGNNVILAACQQPAADPKGGAAGEECGHGSGCGCSDCCGCGPTWIAYGELLYLRPRSAEVTYGVPFNGPAAAGATPIQIAPEGVVDFDFRPGIRVGLARTLTERSTVGVSYTWFESYANDAISTSAPFVIRSMVVHPSTLTAASDGLNATASAGIKFDVLDAEIRRVFSWSDLHTFSWVAGARYAHLQQSFRSVYAVLGSEAVATNVNFDGGGIRLGLDGERFLPDSGLMVYGRANVSFVGGEFTGRYTQTNVFAGTVVDTSWKAAKAITIADIEIGMGWASADDSVRASVGYMFSGWYDVVKTNDFIQAVQKNSFTGLGDTMSFDGLVARVEVRY